MSNGKVIPAVNSRKSISGRYVRARFSYSATGENCLSFQEGDIILVNSRDSSGWWDGIVGGVRGWFPSNFVEPVSLEDVPLEGVPVAQHDFPSSTSSIAICSLMGSMVPKTVAGPLASPSQDIHSFYRLQEGDATQIDNRLSVASSDGSSNPSVTHRKSQSLKLIRAWDSAVDPILKGITQLNSSIKAGKIHGSSAKCRHIATQILFLVGKTIADWNETSDMIVHARNVTEKLGKLLVASKLLDSPWNGTDFQEVLRFQAGQLLLSLRTLVSSGYLLEIEPFLVDASPPSALLAKFIGDEMVLLFSYWLKEITDIVAFIGKSASEKGAPETMVTRKILLAGMHCGRLTYTAEILNEILRLTKDTRLKFLGLKSKLSDLTVGLMRIYDALKSHFDLAAVFEYSIALMDTTGEIVNIFKEDISWCRGLGDSFLRDDIPSLANEFTLSQDLLYRSYQEEFGLVALPQQGQVKKVMEALISLDSSKHEILIFTGYESKATTNSDPKSKKKLQTDEKKLPTAPNSDTLLRSSTRFVLLESTEDTVLKAFLLSFHEMGSSIQLLSEIKQITQKASRDKQLLERIGHLLCLWQDFFWIKDLDEACVDVFYALVTEDLALNTDTIERLLYSLKLKANNEESKLPLLFPESPSAAPRPILPKGKNWKLFDLDSLEISRQLTLIEAGIFVKILPHELYKGEWLVKNRKSRAGNVRTMTSFSTSVKVSGWVARTILGEPDLKRRIIFIKFFIKLAEKCLAISNFNSTMAIKSALQSASISRLKKSWGGISDKYLEMLNTVCQATDHNHNFQTYRSTLKRAKRPCLPFLGLFLTDLTFVEESSPDLVPGEEKWNFDKASRVYQTISSLISYQQLFPFQPVGEIQIFLMSLINTSEDYDAEAMYQRSLHLEPREQQQDKLDKTLTMLQKTGIL